MLTSAAGLSIIVAFLALWLTLENFLRKTSLNISGKLEFYNYKAQKSGYSYDTSLSSFQLNNYKDKTVVIYRAYLSLRNGLYIQILDASKNHILLKAYDTHLEKLDMLFYYKLNNEFKVIQDSDISKAKLYLDTNEGKYKVRNGRKAWIPANNKTLFPISVEQNHNLNVKFCFYDPVKVSMGNPTVYQIEYGQKTIDVSGKTIDVSNISSVDDLKALLNKESPPIAQGYYVWDPIKKLHEQYPDWINAKKINFKNFLIEAIRTCLTKFRK
ncbi:hypothetical protein F9230_16440 [Acinetobacter johnsonii]|uniref:hypothetical protein n=1 Tax=Acinetobacter johnsonii TaxID=40214 RepID=UPI001F251BD1|nr:hypothetical protein [Acinetobacter johnsonii]UJA05836.1 hypothetical protein F9230_16440 [Acinetobacter johnsonii]